MSALQQIVPVAQLLGLSSASALSAYIASFSFLSVPAVLMAPSADLAARQWQKLYELGKASAPPFAATCAVCFSFLAYHSRGIPGRFALSPSTLYLAAAIAAPSIVPYTLTIMMPSVKALESKANGDAKVPNDVETMALVKKWSGQNVHRALLVAMSALLGGTAILAGA